MVKFKLLAQFLVDYLAQPIVSRLMLLFALILIINIKFSVLLSIFYNPLLCFYQRPCVGESNDYMYSFYLCFIRSLLLPDIFRSH